MDVFLPTDIKNKALYLKNEWSYNIQILTEARPNVEKHLQKVWWFVNCLFRFY